MTPDEHTIQETFLDVGDGHSLYIQEWGNKSAKKPVLFLHGGPGSGGSDKHKSRFDPKRQRVIFFDQRGSGRSTPYGSLEQNTTQDLVDDITKILKHLGIEQVIITGGSWGSCLALAYALAHPERVRAMVLNGIFTGSQEEIDWFDKGGLRNFHPDAWEKYQAGVPEAHRSDPTAYHFERLLGSNEAAAKASGYVYENLAGAVFKLDDRTSPSNYEDYDPSSIRIEAHYMANTCFMPDQHILQNASRLKMPVYLVQGRYDMICPPAAAYKLSQNLAKGELIWTISGQGMEHESWNVVRTLLLQLTAEPS